MSETFFEEWEKDKNIIALRYASYIKYKNILAGTQYPQHKKKCYNTSESFHPMNKEAV